MAYLKRLDLEATAVTRAGVQAFQQALPGCEIVTSFGTFKPVADRDRLAAEWVLESGGVVRVRFKDGSSTNVRLIEQRPSAPFTLSTVNLTGIESVASSDLERLVGLRSLATLNIGGTACDATAVPHIVGMPHLRYLLFERNMFLPRRAKTSQRCRYWQRSRCPWNR